MMKLLLILSICLVLQYTQAKRLAQWYTRNVNDADVKGVTDEALKYFSWKYKDYKIMDKVEHIASAEYAVTDKVGYKITAVFSGDSPECFNLPKSHPKCFYARHYVLVYFQAIVKPVRHPNQIIFDSIEIKVIDKDLDFWKF